MTLAPVRPKVTAGTQPPAVLYHYTSEMHLPHILSAGYLRLTESNIDFSGGGPGVVWLTTTPTGEGNGLYGAKGVVRLTITPPRAATHHWPDWSREQGIEEFWYNALASAAEGDPRDWWVCTEVISLTRSVTKIEVNGVEIPKAQWSTGRTSSILDDLDTSSLWKMAARRTAGPNSDHIPERFRSQVPPTAAEIRQGRPVVLDRPAEEDLSHLPKDVLKRLLVALDAVEEGRAALEAKSRDLTGAFSLRLTNSWRAILYFGREKFWHLFAVTDHDYDEVSRRWAALQIEAGMNGSLPDGITFKVGGPGELPEDYPYSSCAEGEREVRALLDGKVIGQIVWLTKVNPSAGITVGHISRAGVLGAYHRRGIATEMLRRAREVDPTVHHSHNLTGDGRAWSQSVAAKEAMPSWRDRGERPEAEALIVPDTGRNRRNSYSVYLYGQPHARRDSLEAAKAVVEGIYGKQDWKRYSGDEKAHHDEVWGPTTLFNDAPYYLAVDRLPRLGATAEADDRIKYLVRVEFGRRRPDAEHTDGPVSPAYLDVNAGERYVWVWAKDATEARVLASEMVAAGSDSAQNPVGRTGDMPTKAEVIHAVAMTVTSAVYDESTARSLFGKGFEAWNGVMPYPGGQIYVNNPREKYKWSKEALGAALRNPHFEEFDPRTLRASQGGITKQGVRYYMGEKYRLTGETFSDPDHEGNRYPVIYVFPDGTHLILSGHHRAVAALLKGEMLRGIRVDHPADFSTEALSRHAVALRRTLSGGGDRGTDGEAGGAGHHEGWLRRAARGIVGRGSEGGRGGRGAEPGTGRVEGLDLQGRTAAVAAEYGGEFDPTDDGWRPTKGMFAPGADTLDPRVFDLATGKMRPDVVSTVLSTLNAYWEPRFGDWRAWARVYLAGSGASYWWDSDADMDILIGVDLNVLRQMRPANRDVTDEDILGTLNAGLRLELRPTTTTLLGFETTWFCNPGAFDIRALHPYAAYDITNDEWVEHPPVLPANWGPTSIPDETWRRCEQAALEAEEVLSLPEPDRTIAGTVMFDWIHDGRKAAYSASGGGWLDPGNVIYQYLTQHPHALLRRLYLCKHPEEGTAAQGIEKAANMAYYAIDWAWQEHLDRQAGGRGQHDLTKTRTIPLLQRLGEQILADRGHSAVRLKIERQMAGESEVEHEWVNQIDTIVVHLGNDMRTKWTMLHEMAHALNLLEGGDEAVIYDDHGPMFKEEFDNLLRGYGNVEVDLDSRPSRTSSRTAMPVGPPPSGIRYRVTSNHPRNPTRSYCILGAVLNGELVGVLTWGIQGRKVQEVWVKPEYRRRRIAENMLERAKWFDPAITHHVDRSDAGDAWVRAVSPDAPEREHNTVEQSAEDVAPRLLLDRLTVSEPRDTVWDVTSTSRPRDLSLAASKISAALRTAMPVGPLPSGIEYRHTAPRQSPLEHLGPNDKPGGTHSISAFLNGKQIGWLAWFDPGENDVTRTNPGYAERYTKIDKAEVALDYRRRGLATEMLRRARAITPGIKHSDRLTGDGREWRDSVSPGEAGTPAYPSMMHNRLGSSHTSARLPSALIRSILDAKPWLNSKAEDVLAGKVPGMEMDPSLSPGMVGHSYLDGRLVFSPSWWKSHDEFSRFLLVTHEVGHSVPVHKVQAHPDFAEVFGEHVGGGRYALGNPWGLQENLSEMVADGYSEICLRGPMGFYEDPEYPPAKALKIIAEVARAEGMPVGQVRQASRQAAMIPSISDRLLLQQFQQYPSSGPEGVSYFKGEIDSTTWVDCLLYFKDGALVGVLNHFPKDMGPERKGNVLILVHPQHRREGIGSALWAEAKKRWNVKGQGQDTSPEGKAFLQARGARTGTFWRVHPEGRAFGDWDATSKPFFNHDDAEPLKGYSCFESPWHLYLYVWIQWSRLYDGTTVLRFPGERVGTGHDGEDLAIPTGLPFKTTWGDLLEMLPQFPLPTSPVFAPWVGQRREYRTWEALAKHWAYLDMEDPVHEHVIAQVLGRRTANVVDYKSDRPLTGQGARPITSLMPGSAMEPFDTLPFADALDAAQGTDRSTSDVAGYLTKRKAWWQRQPVTTVPLSSKFTVTQDNVNMPRVQEIIEHPERGGSEPIWMVRAHGRLYTLNGHHRLVAEYLKGSRSIEARVVDVAALGRTAKIRQSRWFHACSPRRKAEVEARGSFPADYAPKQANWGPGVYLINDDAPSAFGEAVVEIDPQWRRPYEFRAGSYATLMNLIRALPENVKADFEPVMERYRTRGVNLGEEFRTIMLAHGYDGVIVHRDGGEDWAVVFKPECAKVVLSGNPASLASMESQSGGER